MKYIVTKKFWITTLHLLFWMVSINVWYFIFNPGVETSGFIKGLDDSWGLLLLINCISFIYCLLPLIWLVKTAPAWLKIAATFVFCVPVLFLLFEWVLPTSKREDLSFFKDLFVSSFLYVLAFHLTIIAAVYLNLKTLISRFLTKSKFVPYILRIGGLICITALFNYALFNFVIDKIFPSLYFISYFKVWELIIIVAVYLIFTTLVFLVWQYAVMLIANREKVQNELSALKAQVNPHFLFNNLNTIYGLATTNVERSKDVILKLSDFLRYVLYDTGADSIPLEKEVEIIKTYVELQKERIDPGITKVSFSAEGDYSKATISPLLLLPLTENCFKHGTGNQPGQITIEIRFDGKRLFFLSWNNIALREDNGIREKGGIGIKNLEKRLNLLYPGRYSLQFEEKEGIFRAELSVELN
jgi:two-component system, LytTR family, sensor kinase